jgi:hypothetical protein
MRRIIFIISLWAVGLNASSQTGIYEPLTPGDNNADIFTRMVYFEPENRLYWGGGFTILGGDTIKYVAYYNGVKWDSIPELPSTKIYYFKLIDTTLYAFGEQLWKKTPATNWTWITDFPHYMGATCVEHYQNELIIMGGFDSINGQYFPCFARYDGQSFSTFSTQTWPINGRQFFTSCVYNNELYVGGQFVNQSGSIRYLMKWDTLSNTWQSFGNLMLPGSSIRKLLIWQNKLYVAGYFTKANGSEGNLIYSYDGQTFSDMGGGFAPQFPSISDITIYNNKLFIVGPTKLNSGHEFGGFVSWDGNEYCIYDTFTNATMIQLSTTTFGFLEFMQDTLVVAGAIRAFNGDTINRIGRYTGDFNPIECVQANNINELENPQQEINIYPNPNNGNFNVVFSSAYNKPVAISVFNNLGQCVYNKQLNSVSAGELVNLNIEELSGGMYFVNIETENNMHTLKIALQK